MQPVDDVGAEAVVGNPVQRRLRPVEPNHAPLNRMTLLDGGLVTRRRNCAIRLRRPAARVPPRRSAWRRGDALAGLGHVAVVGASLAGTRAAEALRREGFGGRLTVIGDEVQRPYQRPPLSKQFLA